MNTEIIASEGMWLTQANIKNELERVFFKRCYPADGLASTDFIEWTDKHKEEWEDKYQSKEQEV